MKRPSLTLGQVFLLSLLGLAALLGVSSPWRRPSRVPEGPEAARPRRIE